MAPLMAPHVLEVSLQAELRIEKKRLRRSIALHTQSDSLTIGGLKRRDPGALANLYDRYGGIVYSVIFRVLGNVGEAEEVVQEVFLRVWMRAHLIDDSCGTLRPWILVIARNRAIDHLRSARMNRSFEHTSYEHFPAPICFDPLLSFSVEAERLREALAKLSSEQRRVIESAYFEGLSQTEISERMKIPLGTVKTRARRALGALRKTLAISAEADLLNPPKPVRAGNLGIGKDDRVQSKN